MHFSKPFILTAFYLLLASSAFSQKGNHGTKSAYTRTRFNAKLLCPVSDRSKYPYQGVGFKLGDPFALTYKIYLSKHFSLAVDVGKASSGLYNRYYHEKFEEDIVNDTLSTGASIQYLTNSVKSDWVGELKFLYAIDAKKISPGLQIYAGLGIQAKVTKLEYAYLYTREMMQSTVGSFDRNRFTAGQTTIVGIEYSYFRLPISAFIEMELFTDIVRDPGWQRFQGGIGLRYIF